MLALQSASPPEMKKTLWAIFSLCALYCVFEFFYIPYPMTGVDEFWFAHHIYQYTQHLPYRDFPPYKTVLGYYVLMWPFYFVKGLFAPLYYIKYEITLINALFFFSIGYWAIRLFKPLAVLLTLTLIISNQLFLIYSAALRVDMLTAWICLLSILCLLNNRVLLAGFSIGLAFLISQKTLWYLVASNGALLWYGLLYLDYRQTRKALCLFNGAAALVIGVYIVFWAHIASWHSVLHSLFYEAYTQAKIKLLCRR